MEPRSNRVKDLLKYNPYKAIEERIWSGIFWSSILLLILWVEICVGIAIARLLLII